MARRGGRVHIPLETGKAISLLLRVKPTAEMPRPGTRRRTSEMAEIEEEFGPIESAEARRIFSKTPGEVK